MHKDKINYGPQKPIFNNVSRNYSGLALLHFHEGKPNLLKFGKLHSGVIKVICMSITVMPSLQMIQD